jgi:hypothetical protein
MLDKIVQIWRPSLDDPKPPIHPYAKRTDCFYCKQEDKRKDEWQAHHGHHSEWIDMLWGYDLVKDCVNWWEQVNSIKWTAAQQKALTRAYYYHLSKVVSTSYWGVTPQKKSDLSIKMKVLE